MESLSRLPSQSGRAALSRTPGPTDSTREYQESYDGGDEGEEGGEGEVYGDEGRSVGSDSDSSLGRPDSVLITEIKDGGGGGPMLPVTDSEDEEDEEDREEDWDTDLELDGNTNILFNLEFQR